MIEELIANVGWFLISILKIWILVLISIGLYAFFRNAVNTFIKSKILEHKKDESEEERKFLEKRFTTVSRVILTTIKISLGLFVVFYVLNILNVNMAPIIASLGIVGLALSFGAQSLIKDYLNGLYFIIENQFNIGDTIKTAGYTGKVEDFNLRRTVLRDASGNVHIIPNSQISTLTNVSKDWSRLEVIIQIAEEKDIEKASEIINNVIDTLLEIPDNKAIFIEEPKLLGVTAIEKGFIELKIWGKTKKFKQHKVSREIRKVVLENFAKKKIAVPHAYSYNPN